MNKACRMMWKSSAILGIALALVGAMLCCETFGDNARLNMMGLLMNGFIAGNLAVIFGSSTAACSLWRVREK